MSAQARAALIVEREYQPDAARCVAAIVKLLTYVPAPSRPVRTADQLEQHDDQVTHLPAGDLAVAGDDRHEHATSTNN